MRALWRQLRGYVTELRFALRGHTKHIPAERVPGVGLRETAALVPEWALAPGGCPTCRRRMWKHLTGHLPPVRITPFEKEAARFGAPAGEDLMQRWLDAEQDGPPS